MDKLKNWHTVATLVATLIGFLLQFGVLNTGAVTGKVALAVLMTLNVAGVKLAAKWQAPTPPKLEDLLPEKKA